MRYGVSVVATGGAPWVMAGHRLGDGIALAQFTNIKRCKLHLVNTMHFVVFKTSSLLYNRFKWTKTEIYLMAHLTP